MFYIFLPPFVCYLHSSHDMSEKNVYSFLFLEKRIILGAFFYNNLNKYLAFTLMCLFVLSDWECFILIRSKYSRYNAFREWYDFNI